MRYSANLRTTGCVFLAAVVLTACGGEGSSASGEPSTEEGDFHARVVTRVVSLQVPKRTGDEELRRLWACVSGVVLVQASRGGEEPKEIERQCQTPAGEGPMILLRRRFTFEVTGLGTDRTVYPLPDR